MESNESNGSVTVRNEINVLKSHKVELSPEEMIYAGMSVKVIDECARVFGPYGEALADAFGVRVRLGTQIDMGYPVTLSSDFDDKERKLAETWLNDNVTLGDPSFTWSVKQHGTAVQAIIQIRKKRTRTTSN